MGEIIEKQFFSVNLYPSINCSCSVTCEGTSAVLFVTTTGFAVLRSATDAETAGRAEVIEHNLPPFGAEVVLGGISACAISQDAEGSGVLVCLSTWGGTSSRVKSTVQLYLLSPDFSSITHLQTMKLQVLALLACVFHDDSLGTWMLLSLDDGTVRSLRYDARRRSLQTPHMRQQPVTAGNVVTAVCCGKPAAGHELAVLFGTSLGEVYVSTTLDEIFEPKNRTAAFAFDGPITAIKQLGDEYLIGVGLGYSALVHFSGSRKPLSLPGGFQHDTLQAIAVGHVACDASADVALGFYDGSLLLCSREEHMAGTLEGAYGDRNFGERCLKLFPFPVYGVFAGNFTTSGHQVGCNAEGEICVLTTPPELVVVTSRTVHVLCYSEQPPVTSISDPTNDTVAGNRANSVSTGHSVYRLTETRPKLQRRIDTIATIFGDLAAALSPASPETEQPTQHPTS